MSKAPYNSINVIKRTRVSFLHHYGDCKSLQEIVRHSQFRDMSTMSRSASMKQLEERWKEKQS